MSEQIHGHARKFLQDFFSDEELTNFCFDYFPQVYNDFTTGMPKSQKVRMVVENSQRRERFDELLAALERERPKSYPDHFSEQPQQIDPKPKPAETIERNPRQIFISHAHQDAEFAQRLAADLRANGWQTWMAPDNIRPGEKWVEAINRGLSESSVFVLLLTPDAVDSRWVKSETNAAIRLEHQGKMQFVPLALEPVSTPPLWENYQKIIFYGDYGQGLQQLLHRFGGGKQGAERPVPPQEVEHVVKSSNLPLIEIVPELVIANDVQPDSFIHPITGKVMMRVPAGKFLYGEYKDVVSLDEFWIDKTPVTNAEYKQFLDAKLRHNVPQAEVLGFRFKERRYRWNKQNRMYPEGKADHPVVLVSWHDARAYAAWANASLPSEKQWEKAARGFDGRIYPWGDDWQNNFCNTKENGIGGTTPVGKYSPKGDSPFGCVDMSGNVWEWTRDRWDIESTHHILRGGSWFRNRNFACVTKRRTYALVSRDFNNGFRLVVHRIPSNLDL